MNMNNYFSHDSNARNSSKMLQVRMKYGAEGYGIYFMLLERLRDEDDYKSVKDYNAIAFDLRVDASIIKAVVEDFGLFVFTDDGKYFYSEGFNKRMAFKDEKSKRRSEAGKKGAQKRWANKDPRENDSNAMAKPSDKNSNTKAIPLHTDSKESKVKESKVNKSKVKEIRKTNRPHAQSTKKIVRHQHGEYQNVLLSDQQLTKLKQEFPHDWQERIERLSVYMQSSGKRYKDHLATIRVWARRDKPTQPVAGNPSNKPMEGGVPW